MCTANDVEACYCSDSWRICVNGCFWSDCSGSHSVCSDEQCTCTTGDGEDACAENADCSSTSQPYADYLASTSSSYCTGIQGTGIAYFQWYYFDPNGKAESQYEIQIDDNFDFSSPEVDRTVYYTGVASGSLQQQMILVKLDATTAGGDYITYNTPYYWRVKVKNSSGVSSVWIYYDADDDNDFDENDTYTYGYTHPAPVPAYSYSPTTVYPLDEVTFSDSSVCYYYDESNQVANSLCSALANTTYAWTFGDSATSTNKGDTTHTYAQYGTLNTSLYICDDLGCCTTYGNIVIKSAGNGEIPSWKEISPF